MTRARLACASDSSLPRHSIEPRKPSHLMRNNADHHFSVLALHPQSRGYAFALFDGPERLIDWGVREIRSSVKHRNVRTMLDVEYLLERLQPDCVVVEEFEGDDSRRAERIRNLCRNILHAAIARGMEAEQIRKEDVVRAFADTGATTRYEVAQVIARVIPALSFRLPAKRRAWEGEPASMGVFAATALALAFYRNETSEK